VTYLTYKVRQSFPKFSTGLKDSQPVAWGESLNLCQKNLMDCISESCLWNFVSWSNILLDFFIFYSKFEGSVTTEKEDSSRREGRQDTRIGQSQLFQERTSSVWDKVYFGRESNPWLGAYNAGVLPSKSSKQSRLGYLDVV
jgi:hypothetical protein